MVGLYLLATTSPLAANPLAAFWRGITSFSLNFLPVTGHVISGLTTFSYTSSSMTLPVFLMTMASWVVMALPDTAQVTFPLVPSSLLSSMDIKSLRRSGSPVMGLGGRSGIGSFRVDEPPDSSSSSPVVFLPASGVKSDNQ
eukprot:CAMPEP_0178697208 /NCGR_PEP_ID=MMETSP0699-20121125/9827_1 /TAXON_ID=265572 /ORGANISM="Extubocellulus spinifer, Strain CCMP396" /LENGTH=140 /DNA_ID=CAMNT_0020343079 /DNA_START=474 /DNA_END=896 /DNA_ORIENTATION=+